VNVFYNFSLFFFLYFITFDYAFFSLSESHHDFQQFSTNRLLFFYQFLSFPVVFILQHCILHMICSIMFIYYFLFHFHFPVLFFFYFSGKYVYTISQNSSGRIPGKRLGILLCSFL